MTEVNAATGGQPGVLLGLEVFEQFVEGRSDLTGMGHERRPSHRRLLSDRPPEDVVQGRCLADAGLADQGDAHARFDQGQDPIHELPANCWTYLCPGRCRTVAEDRCFGRSELLARSKPELAGDRPTGSVEGTESVAASTS